MFQHAEQPALRGATDTSTPTTPIPIYYLHSVEQPFCNRPGCLCLAYFEQIRALFEGAKEQGLQIRQVLAGQIYWEVQHGRTNE